MAATEDQENDSGLNNGTLGDGDHGIMNEGVSGVSKKKFLLAVDNDTNAAESSKLEDGKY